MNFMLDRLEALYYRINRIAGRILSVLLVLMDEEYEPYAIYEAEREELLEFMQKSSSSRAKRGALSVARFKIIGNLVWARDGGLEPELWDNQA